MQDITSVRDELLVVCDRVACLGEECVFFSVNVLKEDIFCCGSSYGQEFLTERASIVQSFLEFCKEKYALNQQQLVKTEIKTEREDGCQNDVTSTGVTFGGGDDDVICIISDDEDEEFEELTAITEAENSNYLIEVERVDAGDDAEASDTQNIIDSESLGDLNTDVVVNGNIKLENNDYSDYVIERNEDEDNMSALSYCEENVVYSENKGRRNNSLKKTENNHSGSLKTDIMSPIKGGLNMCQTCGESFFSVHALQNHIKLHISRRDVKKAYMRIHAGEKPFNCNICGKQFQETGPLTSHMKLHKKSSSFVDDVDGNVIGKTDKNLLYQCRICNGKFKTSSLLQAHMDNKHSKGTQFHKCCVCGKFCSTWYNLKQHTLSHFRDKQADSKRKHIRNRCSYCFKSFSNFSNRKRHELLHRKQKSLKITSGRNKRVPVISNIPVGNRHKSSYKCHICLRPMRKFYDLKVHAMRHFNHDKHNCGVCGRHFIYPAHLRSHWKTHIVKSRSKVLTKANDDNENDVKIDPELMEDVAGACGKRSKDSNKEIPTCKICHRIFNDKGHLLLHMKHHVSKNLHQCKICDKSFRVYYSLKIHLARKHKLDQSSYKNFAKVIPIGSQEAEISRKRLKDSDKIACQTCGKLFSERRYLTFHLNNHCRLANRCRCSVCFQTFKDIAQLKVHSIKCTLVSRPHQCKVCGKRCANIGNLKQHAAIHRKKDTGKVEKTKVYNSAQSKTKLNSSPKESNDNPFTCHTCGKRCLSSQGLKNHSKIHLKKKPEFNSDSKAVLEKTFYLCRLCDEAFEDSNLLKKHWKVHGDQEKLDEKPFQCKTCLKTFFDKDVLKWHESTHLQKKAHQCKICNVKVFGSDTFKVHMQLHKIF